MTEIESLQQQVTQFSGQVEDLSGKVDTLTAEVRSLLNLWEQARGVVTFVKWTAAILGCIGGFLIFIKPYLKV